MLPRFSRADYPEKNGIHAKQNDHHLNDNAPFASPKRISFIERKKNEGRILVDPHVKEYMRYSSDETGEVDRFERIAHFAWIEPEKPINVKDGLLEPPLHYINN